jgi:hypothetical protein
MACRSMDRANAARTKLIKEAGVAESKLLCLKLDLCGFDSVKKFIKVCLACLKILCTANMQMLC